MHAVDYLKNPSKTSAEPVTVVHGPDGFLRGEVLRTMCRQLTAADNDDASVVRLAGAETELRRVTDELRTVSMWGDARVVVVDDADTFVSNYRSGLEKYAAAPAKQSTFILAVKSWPKNTRLAKEVAKTGLDIECSPLKGAALLKWLSETARDIGEKQLTRADAAVLVELAGTETGLLSQELAKLAAYVGDRRRISEDDIRTVVGGWAVQTAFAMLDELAAGRLPKALELLDRLLASGEPPQKILGAMSFSYKRLATGVEHARQGMGLKQALAKAGVFRSRIDSTNAYLRRIGRPRAEKFLAAILEADVNLKGGSRGSERVELERLLMRLSGQLPVEMS